ncbi:MAG: aldo/keto reductase [Defluviitaleaceae bacterium]|nr:aldo/keto reductase [Defluviitaleaceae bacterium]
MMQKTMLGKTGLEISRVTFGGIICMDEAQKDADRFVSHAIDAGVNYFDVAPSYGNAEEKLGPAFKNYRSKAFLACKTTERSAEGARRELENSLKTLQTDYFDVYQMHSLSEQADIDKAFAEDGVMRTIIAAKKEGLIRNIGITAHSEKVALEALSRFDFDTVMFPFNWALNIGKGFGSELIKACKEKGIGILGIKSIAHRHWREDEVRVYPKSWCKTIFTHTSEEEQLGLCAMKHALSLGVDSLVPPGNFTQFEFMVKHFDECAANPISEAELAYLKDCMPEEKEYIFAI